jgi:hypothetical protein
MKKSKILTMLLALTLVIFVASGVYKSIREDYTIPSAGNFVDPLKDNIVWGPSTDIRGFFPAHANLQWLSGVTGYTHAVGGTGSTASHAGSNSVISGNLNCRNCHESKLKTGDFGETLVNTESGIPGKEAFKDMSIQAAFDNEFLYLKAEWKTQRPRPGVSHQAYQFLNGTWVQNTKNKTPGNSSVGELGTDEFFSYEDRFSVMLAPTSVGEEIKSFGDVGMNFNQAGCFVACHSSMRYMPEAPASSAVQADPWLGTGGLKVSDIRHYLLHTRGVKSFADANNVGNWQTTANSYDATKQKADLNNEKFIDLWQLRGARSAPMYGSSNDAVLDYRHSGIAEKNRGDNYWFDQNPAGTQPPNAGELWYDTINHIWKDLANTPINVASYIWMYDSLKTGFYAVPPEAVVIVAGELNLDWTIQYPLITQGADMNAILLDNSKINSGDILPRQVLRRGTGIRGAALNTFSKWDAATGKWIVIFRRKLNQIQCDQADYGTHCSDLTIKKEDLMSSGQGVTIAFAVFDDHSTARFHHVTFPYTLQDKVGADIRPFNNTVGIKHVSTNSFDFVNYPNPFYESTKFEFTLSQSDYVSINVYDMSGRLVKTLVNNQKTNAGKQTVIWNAQNNMNGTYIVRLKVGNAVQTRRVILVK